MNANRDPLGDFDDFTRAVRRRMEIGQREYKDRSFTRDPADLLIELSQEALDLAGWGFILWVRTRRAITAVEVTRVGGRGIPASRRRVPRDDEDADE